MVKDDGCELLNGIIECDETYVGAKAQNIHKKRLAKMTRGRDGYDNKTMVMGAIERGGRVRRQMGEGKGLPATKETLHTFIKSKIADEAKAIFTDQHKGYNGIADEDTLHLTVDHARKERCAVSCIPTRRKTSGTGSSGQSSALTIKCQ